jgi:tRNA(Ile)-lysidine synthase
MSLPFPTNQSVLSQFINTVRRHAMWSVEDRLLIGVSGGADSVALTLLALETGMKIGIAHINYQLRGAESDGDEAFVRNLAQQYDVPLYVHRADIHRQAHPDKHSIQVIARRVRYSWWSEVAEREGFSRILTGHQADDQLETMLLWLIRGGATTSFAGIPYVRGRICRPLLDLSRADIRSYLTSKQQPWREDSSNLSNTYVRNQLRREIIPLLNHLRPGITNHISRTADSHQQIYLAGKSNATQLLEAHSSWDDHSFRINLHHLSKVPYVRFILHEALVGKGFTSNQIENILEAMSEGRSGALFQSLYWEATLHKGILEGRRMPASEEAFHFTWNDPAHPLSTPPGRLDVELHHEGAPAHPNTHDPHRIWVDADQLIWPLTLRSRRPGDRLRPYGMNGVKKVKDILIEAGLNAFEKDRVLLLCQGDSVLWIPGFRMADTVRIRAQTRRSILLRWVPA